MAERKNIGITRRWFTIAATTGLAVPLMTVSAADATSSSEHLLSVFGDDIEAVVSEVEASGGTVLETYDVADALLVSLPAGVAPPAGAVSVPDSKLEFQAADTEEQTTAGPTNTYRETLGLTANDQRDGDGVTVALIDTGVADTTALDVDHVNVSGGPDGDGLGHGTFLAGLIAGNGANSADNAYQGVAPAAKVLDVQVAMPDGSTSMSRVLAGLQAVSEANAADSSVRVVNLALNSGSPLPPWIDPLNRGLENLWAQGMTVVVASGNDGPNEIASPASDPTLIATGSVEENKSADRSDDTLADFSSYGMAFGEMRPDFAAPGVSLVSLRAANSIADLDNESARVGDHYFKGTGTSMSAAVASGAAAVLLAERNGLEPNDVKRLFRGTAYSAQLGNGAGAGGLDLNAAMSANVGQLPPLPTQNNNSEFGPDAADSETWAAFAAAWASGDLKTVVDAWGALSPQTRKWAATSWSLGVLGRSLSMAEGDFEGRRWAGRRWASQKWEGRRWAEDKWIGRRWAAIDWGSKKWASGTWDSLNWEGRRWASQDWLAFAWSTRNISADPQVGDNWVVEGSQWDGRRWAGDNWQGRRWATTDWAGRRWADEAWAGRRWADFVYSGRRWAGDSWQGRRWAGDDWEGRRWAGRRWAGDDWQGRRWAGRRWAADDWDGRRWAGRRWAADEWDGRRWAGRRWATGSWSGKAWDAMTFEGRRWASDDWSGRRWA